MLVTDHRILVNVQASSADVAAAAAERYGDRVLVGVVARDFPSPEDGARHILALHARGVAVSAGLGDGAADQWERALRMALASRPLHLNQVFPAAALSQHALHAAGAPTVVNALVRPTGVPGMVAVGTGPESQRHVDAALPVSAALDMVLEVGVRAVKFFPMGGAAGLDELRAVADAAAERGMLLEPTGGITPENLGEILDVCLSAGVVQVMPHLYGSLKDPGTKDVSMARLAEAMTVVDGFGSGRRS